MKDDARQLLEFADYKREMQRKVQGLEADNLWLRSEVERLKSEAKGVRVEKKETVESYLVVVPDPAADSSTVIPPVKRSKRG